MRLWRVETYPRVRGTHIYGYGFRRWETLTTDDDIPRERGLGLMSVVFQAFCWWMICSL